MASSDMLYLNLFMFAIVAMYVFGGESPLVSQTTAVAVGLTQALLLLSGGVAYVASPIPKKVEDCCDMKDACTTPTWVAVVVSQSASIMQSFRCQCAAGLLVVFLLGRFLRTTCSLSASQAIPLGLLFGALVKYAAKTYDRSNRAGSDTQGRENDEEDKHGDSAPFVDSFGNDSDPDFFGKLEPQEVGLADEVKLDSSEMLSGVLLDFMFEKEALPDSQAIGLADTTGLDMESFFDDHDHVDGNKVGESGHSSDDGERSDAGASPSSEEFPGKLEPRMRPLVDDGNLESSEILSDVLLDLMFEKK